MIRKYLLFIDLLNNVTFIRESEPSTLLMRYVTILLKLTTLDLVMYLLPKQQFILIHLHPTWIA